MIYDGKMARHQSAIKKMAEEAGKHSIAYKVDRCFQQDWELIINGKAAYAGYPVCCDDNTEFAISCDLFESAPFSRRLDDKPIGTMVFDSTNCKSGYLLLSQDLERNNPTVTLRGETLNPIDFAQAQRTFGIC